MMTREEVLVEMEASYAQMTEEEKNMAVTNNPETGEELTPTQLLQAVRDNTELGQKYWPVWAANAEAASTLEGLLDQLLGECPLPEGMGVFPLDSLLDPGEECDDPECEVHGKKN